MTQGKWPKWQQCPMRSGGLHDLRPCVTLGKMGEGYLISSPLVGRERQGPLILRQVSPSTETSSYAKECRRIWIQVILLLFSEYGSRVLRTPSRLATRKACSLLIVVLLDRLSCHLHRSRGTRISRVSTNGGGNASRTRGARSPG